MNGLTLRINKSEKKTVNNHVKFNIISLTISQEHGQNGFCTELLDNFNNCTSVEKQLGVCRELIDNNKDNDLEIANFLADVFLQATAKHPIRAFLIRHINETSHIQGKFTDVLVTKIKHLITIECSAFSDFVDVVNKVASCTENFPVGLAAVRRLDLVLAAYLKDCLLSCMAALSSKTIVTPTDKNDIFNLAHLTLRLLLNVMQKLETDKIANVNSILKDIKLTCQQLMLHDDVPMDTKSVCGIVYLTVYMLEGGSDSWIHILSEDPSLGALLHSEAVQMSLYSAIVTTVPINDLQTETVANVPAIIALTEKILTVGERSSSESMFVLSVARSVLQISKLLHHVRDSNVGLWLVEHLLLFIWGHLDHHMDSVRHLTPQALGFISKNCKKLKDQGNTSAIEKLLSSLTSLDRSRKVYFVIVKLLASDLGAGELMDRIPGLVVAVLEATGNQAVQASATSALETLIQKHAQENKGRIDFDVFVSPILARIQKEQVTSIELDVLEGLLMTAFKLDPDFEKVKPHIDIGSSKDVNLKCVLVLLSVIRKCVAGNKWREYMRSDVIKMAATDADDETRILSLSFMVTSPKSTEMFEQGDLDFILYFLKYNINAQSPNFRQLVLSLLKKFLKRFDDSFKVIKRQKHPKLDENKDHYYIAFLEDLRAFCFHSLIPGANYSRRVVALQTLVWSENIEIDEYSRKWEVSYVEKLLLHLEDSYESNKANALEILEHCPIELLKCKTHSIPLDLKSIIEEANSTKPTDCVSASYKLALLIRKLPEYITTGDNLSKNEVCHNLLKILLSHLESSLSVCERSIAEASQKCPMYGIVRCVRRCLQEVDVSTISSTWGATLSALVCVCVRVTSSVGVVVNNSSPEGHLPMDMGGVAVDDAGNSGGLTLKDGRLVTAQMVLLCAWRSVKEVSLLLGDTSRFPISGENNDSIEGVLAPKILSDVDRHFTSLLTETKHRGAFEQAYVGYTMFLTRMWRSRNPSLTSSLNNRLDDLLSAIQAGGDTLSATRRSAGVPYMIQALLTTELSVSGSTKSFNRVMSTLLSLARNCECVETRTHCINILRALYRCTHLQDTVSGFVGEGLLAAMEGFRSCSWMERNASTLLFSALLTRVFGVSRARHDVNIRNKMTGRIFFLRYPNLYDYMLTKLEEASSVDSERELRPALYPVLLLLSRLYPSSLEGIVSNLKLCAFLPYLLSSSRSAVLGTRTLAARAIQPLLPPHRYFEHIEAMLELLANTHIKRNFCHGIILQLCILLQGNISNLALDEDTCSRLCNRLERTLWILVQAASNVPCYLIADEYMKMINLMLWKFPQIIDRKMLLDIEKHVQTLLFHENETSQKSTKEPNSGKEVCLSNAVYLKIVLMTKSKYEFGKIIAEFLNKALKHDAYEVNLAAMNYLLLGCNEIEKDNCLYLQHLEILIKKENQYPSENYLRNIQTKSLLNIFENTKYLECHVKSLQLLTLQKGNQELIVRAKINKTKDNHLENEYSIGCIAKYLIDCIDKDHENITHIYLKNLLDFFIANYENESTLHLDVFKVMFNCCSSENSDDTRRVIVRFLNEYGSLLYGLCWTGEDKNRQFEAKATFLATIVILLEDDDQSIRDHAAKVVTKLINNQIDTVSSKAAEELRNVLFSKLNVTDAAAMFLIFALLDFKSEVRLNDEINDQCRVFDQSERYNIHLEETIWTCACADLIQTKCGDRSFTQTVRSICHNNNYRQIIVKLCNDNFTLFGQILNGEEVGLTDVVNPKIKLFANKIKEMDL